MTSAISSDFVSLFGRTKPKLSQEEMDEIWKDTGFREDTQKAWFKRIQEFMNLGPDSLASRLFRQEPRSLSSFE
ncbi:hypothetical protein J437_LFUL018099 [Ladona fulva]|uniref:Uncharacterized protein n=1 Tax=Ladona fulva TaxID=123851 RepID=A0A8K0KMJ4_LADFU|nr:hypothetical protein J437_LFUL018099 [Ladona fulva]